MDKALGRNQNITERNKKNALLINQSKGRLVKNKTIFFFFFSFFLSFLFRFFSFSHFISLVVKTNLNDSFIN